MAYLIGTDEAGYGPNLGPLIVSATVWHLPDESPTARLFDIDLYQRLQYVVTRRAPHEEDPQCVWIADSKDIYKPRGSLANLEHGVLSALESCADTPGTWSQVWRRLDPGALDQCRRAPWYQRARLRVPTAAGANEVARSAQRLRSAYQVAGCRLLGMYSEAVFPNRFNELLVEHGNKSTLLSRVTLGLVGRALASLPLEPTLVVCDKHGGRNKYAPLLQTQFDKDFVQVRHESRAESVYWQGLPATRLEFRFRVGGESFLPSALASMTSKYLRELSMKVFNRYWQRKVPGITPTAGYPLDARRFRKEICTAQRELEISDQMLWRQR